MNLRERPIMLELAGAALAGIVHTPLSSGVRTGVVIVVGGPQYRVGSHRQFVLLARDLVASGVPVIRFDLVGMGDSEGDPRGFENSSDAIRAAIDRLMAEAPGIDRVCLWGLCDGASAAIIYAPSDPRVAALVLANPWVRTAQGLSQSYFENYYSRRLRDRRFWAKLLRRPSTVWISARDLAGNLLRSGTSRVAPQPAHPADHYLVRMLAGAETFRGAMLILLSGNDLVATEFELARTRWPRWSVAFGGPRVRIERLPGANHTFSRREWRDWVARSTLQFVVSQ